MTFRWKWRCNINQFDYLCTATYVCIFICICMYTYIQVTMFTIVLSFYSWHNSFLPLIALKIQGIHSILKNMSIVWGRQRVNYAFLNEVEGPNGLKMLRCLMKELTWRIFKWCWNNNTLYRHRLLLPHIVFICSRCCDVDVAKITLSLHIWETGEEWLAEGQLVYIR